MVIPPIIALYYGTLDIWGDDWSWVKNHKGTHSIIFAFLASLTILILFFKGVSEAIKGKVEKKYHKVLDSLLTFFNTLVKKKKDRFYKRAKHVKPSSDVFKSITQPIDQLEYVLDGTKSFLVDGFGIDQKNIGITIIQGFETDDLWWYRLQCDSQKKHTRAKDLVKSSSTARYCLDSGDSLFIPDIRKGIKENLFLESNRSKQSSTGSIYCKPVRIEVGGIDYVYIFTIAVYGQNLCVPFDEEECRSCEKILDEVGDRIELELYLHSIKEFRSKGGKAS